MKRSGLVRKLSLTLMIAARRSVAVAYWMLPEAAASSKRSRFLAGSSTLRIVVPTLRAPTGPTVGAMRRTTPTMMPEGPEVRTLVDQLQPAVGMRLIDLRFLSGRYVRHARPKGFDEFKATMTPYARESRAVAMDGVEEGAEGADDRVDRARPPGDQRMDVVTEWNAKGKFIYIILDDGNTPTADGNDCLRSIWVTLGMSGRFVSESREARDADVGTAGSDKHARWYLEFLDPTTLKTHKIFYHDTRNFGTLRFSLSEKELMAKLASLGPDILREGTTVETFLGVLDRQRQAMNVCKFLMDQSKMCGVGNYILAEGLYRANIDPFASLSELSGDQKRSLFHELQATAQLSYSSQGLTRQKGGSYRNVDGELGKFEFSLQCYGRDQCARGRPVLRETNGPHKRTIWYVEDQLFVPRSMRGPDGQITSGTAFPATSVSASAADGGGGIFEADRSSSLGDFLYDPSWKEALSDVLSSEKFSELSQFVASERESGSTVYPPEEDVFSSLNLCPLEDVRVVCVGQDPYHGPGQGHGLAFSVREGVRPPPSLQNIFREAMDDVGISPPPHGFLECWASQGVLLLNSVLTVRRGEANSHARKGWEVFTDGVINVLNDRKEGLVFLLWGGPAAKKAAAVDETKHTVIKTSHPSPLGATKTSSPFLGSKCFSRANAALIKAGKDPIDWTVR